MNITYLIGLLFAIIFMLFGMVQGSDSGLAFDEIKYFYDLSSIFITIGCTISVIVAGFPAKMLVSIPKHFAIMLNTKKYKPSYYIDQLVELAQVARQNGLLALEKKAYEQKDPFFRQAIILIMDANDPEKVKSILNNDIECMSARHDDVASMYDKAAAVAPAFGMVGTLVGLVKMLKNMSTAGTDSIGPAMGTALITTLYGSILANVVFTPIASNLRARDEEETLCKLIIVEGVTSIQSGENPKFLREKLLTFTAQKQREGGMSGRGKAQKSAVSEER